MSSSAPLREQAALPLPVKYPACRDVQTRYERYKELKALSKSSGSKYKEPKLAQASASYEEDDDSLEDDEAEKAPAVKQTLARASRDVEAILSDPSFWRDVEARIESYKESKGLSKSLGSKHKKANLAQASYKEDVVCLLEDGVSAEKARAKKAGAKRKKGKKKAKKPKEVTTPSDFAFDDYTPGDLCNICDGAHKTGYCRYWLSVPPNAHVNDGYVRRCTRCGSSVSYDLKCPVHLRSKIRAFVEMKEQREYVLRVALQSKIVE